MIEVGDLWDKGVEMSVASETFQFTDLDTWLDIGVLNFQTSDGCSEYEVKTQLIYVFVPVASLAAV